MKITINIETDNQSFEDSNELNRILHEVADQLTNAQKNDTRNIKDINGNTVGKWVVG